jgi:3-hydroxyacyl-[acyl-carrier-protein] dehydratase
VEAAVRFRERGDATEIPTIVYGLIERYQPATSAVRLADANDDTRLVEDLGLDSLTLLELVLSIEEVLQLRIENEELKAIRTVGQMKKFLQEKISGTQAAPTAEVYTRDRIALVLPQQPPFLFLDSAELDGETVKASYTIKGDESFLEGHFRDEPIFPASILFEALGQAACLWMLERAPKVLGKTIPTNHIFFTSLDGAHVYRKMRPLDRLVLETKLNRLREPLAIFQGRVTTADGERVAQIDRLVLAFGEQPPPAEPAAATAS